MDMTVDDILCGGGGLKHLVSGQARSGRQGNAQSNLLGHLEDLPLAAAKAHLGHESSDA
jgi:hypothetical protein